MQPRPGTRMRVPPTGQARGGCNGVSLTRCPRAPPGRVTCVIELGQRRSPVCVVTWSARSPQRFHRRTTRARARPGWCSCCAGRASARWRSSGPTAQVADPLLESGLDRVVRKPRTAEEHGAATAVGHQRIPVRLVRAGGTLRNDRPGCARLLPDSPALSPCAGLPDPAK